MTDYYLSDYRSVIFNRLQDYAARAVKPLAAEATLASKIVPLLSRPHLPIISAEDLIVLKAAFNRPNDWVDIETMFQIQQDRVDAGYVRRGLSEFYAPPDDAPLRSVEGFIRAYTER